MKFWTDTTQDVTGHYIAKDLFKAIGFYVAVAICIADAVVSGLHGSVNTGPAVLLLGYAFSVGAAKGLELYFNRKVADGNGQPLMQAGTAEAPADPVLPAQAADQKIAPAADVPEAD